MEADDDCRRYEDAGRIERSGARDIARVERQLDARDLSAILVGAAAGLIVETLEKIRQIVGWLFALQMAAEMCDDGRSLVCTPHLHINVAFEWIARIEIDGDRGRAALDFRLALNAVVNGNRVKSASQQQQQQQQRQRCKRKRNARRRAHSEAATGGSGGDGGNGDVEVSRTALPHAVLYAARTRVQARACVGASSSIRARARDKKHKRRSKTLKMKKKS